MKNFSRPNYEIGTAPFLEILAGVILAKGLYDDLMTDPEVGKGVNALYHAADGIGHRGDWSIRVDKAAKSCIVDYIKSKYNLVPLNVSQSIHELDLKDKCRMRDDIEAFLERKGDYAAQIFTDKVSGITAEELSHSFEFEHEKKENLLKTVIQMERDHGFFQNFANMENFNDNNTVDLGD